MAPQETPASENPQADEEAKHRRYERIVGTVTLIATLCAAGFAGGAYVQAKRQADIAQSALVESDHPFLVLTLRNRPSVVKGGKTYIALTATITNHGSRAAALKLVHLAVVNDPAEVVPSPKDGVFSGMVAFASDCIELRGHKVIPGGGSMKLDCTSEVPVPENGAHQHFAGLFSYTGQSGVVWGQWVDLMPDYQGGWMENISQPAFNQETTIGPQMMIPVKP